jgi:NADPH-dependent curcumin reductase CurA
MAQTNRRWIYAQAPAGAIETSNFTLNETPAPQPAEGEALIRTTMLSIDPASRAWMAGATYRSKLEPGDVMAGWGLGEVVESRAAALKPGDLVSGEFGWQQFIAVPAQHLTKHDPRHRPEHILSVYGITGLTAYFGLLDVGKPRPGETVLVSAAAGAVGNIAGQIAKIAGCRVIGTAGGAEKCEWLKRDLGFDAALAYKAGGIYRQLKAAAPEGIDVYFDNTGGDVISAALSRMNIGGRIACCGNVSQYDTATPAGGPAGVPGLLVTKRIRMEGFIVMDFYGRRRQAEETLARWVEEGRLNPAIDIVDGFENMPAALTGMFAGKNRGKLLVRV